MRSAMPMAPMRVSMVNGSVLASSRSGAAALLSSKIMDASTSARIVPLRSAGGNAKRRTLNASHGARSLGFLALPSRSKSAANPAATGSLLAINARTGAASHSSLRRSISAINESSAASGKLPCAKSTATGETRRMPVMLASRMMAARSSRAVMSASNAGSMPFLLMSAVPRTP